MKRVFISADIEGVTGVVHFHETEREKDDYGIFRRLMTGEVNAAITGVLDAGADDVVVRDAHGDARNILPEELNPAARLIRGWADTPLCMMEGIGACFDAVVFIGYHAAADVPNATLKHTMNLRIAEVQVNGILMAEAGLNALIAGMFDVPVICIAGDQAICDYAKRTFGEIEVVAVKDGIGSAALNLHPEKTRDLIRTGARRGLERLAEFTPFKPDPPYEFVVRYRYEHSAFRAAFYPGVERLDNVRVRFASDDLMACFHFFYFCQE
ncbi:M55 family metallopeptidase [bacterium]|nr:M55 family metallopeptidase [candidate division CSSED10-310 bacterium]